MDSETDKSDKAAEFAEAARRASGEIGESRQEGGFMPVPSGEGDRIMEEISTLASLKIALETARKKIGAPSEEIMQAAQEYRQQEKTLNDRIVKAIEKEEEAQKKEAKR